MKLFYWILCKKESDLSFLLRTFSSNLQRGKNEEDRKEQKEGKRGLKQRGKEGKKGETKTRKWVQRGEE